MRSLDKATAALVFQVVNQLANFLEYSEQRGDIEPLASTLRQLQTRMRAQREHDRRFENGVQLSDAERTAVVALIPAVVRSLGEVEFSLRTGYQATDALATRDRLAG